MKTAIITGSLLVALAGRAAAQPGMTEPGLDTAPPPPAAQAPAGTELSESTALALSLGGTVGSWALLIGSPLVAGADNEGAAALMSTAGALGIVFAPSFGHWYADKYLTRGLGLRLGGAAIVFAGAFVAFMEEPISFGHDDGPSEDDGEAVVGPAIAIAGLGMFVWGTIDDIVTAPGRVRRVNRERAGIDLAITPLVTQQSAGFALGGRF